jgi:hypothetical protein
VANQGGLDVPRGSTHPSHAADHRLEEGLPCLGEAGVSRLSPGAEVGGTVSSGKAGSRELAAVRTRHDRLGLRRPLRSARLWRVNAAT